MIIRMDMVYKHGKMVLNILENIKMGKNRVKGNINGRMALVMMEIG